MNLQTHDERDTAAGRVPPPQTCYHCELDPEKRRWLDPYSACSRCKAESPLPAYDAARVRGTLSGLFPGRDRGIRRPADVGLLAHRLDVERALLELASQEILLPIEANVVVWRFIKQQTVEALAAAIGCSESTAKRATRSALIKIRDFLNAGTPIAMKRESDARLCGYQDK